MQTINQTQLENVARLLVNTRNFGGDERGAFLDWCDDNNLRPTKSLYSYVGSEVNRQWRNIQAREQDERAAMIEALIESDLRDIERGNDLIRQVLTWGFDGYENVSTYDLRDEMKIRGLEL